MHAVVVYESLWGNTAAVARAIAEGIGPDARAVPTDEATPELVAAADLIVAGAPVMAFRLPTDGMRQGAAQNEKNRSNPPDVDHPSMRHWLETLPHGQAPFAAFETRLHWSPGGATGAIEKGLGQAGYRRIEKGGRFIVEGTQGPLRDGELERARAWGAELARAAAS